MNDRPTNASGHLEPSSADVDAATRRLMAALDALESAVERRREADRDEDELATRIQALGADRSRLADELDGSLVKTRKLERANRESPSGSMPRSAPSVRFLAMRASKSPGKPKSLRR